MANCHHMKAVTAEVIVFNDRRQFEHIQFTSAAESLSLGLHGFRTTEDRPLASPGRCESVSRTNPGAIAVRHSAL
jgi:hypothetical protein